MVVLTSIYHKPKLDLLKKQALRVQRMLVIKIFFYGPVGFEPLTSGIQAHNLYGTILH